MNKEIISSKFLFLLLMAVVSLSYSADGISLSSSISTSQQNSSCKNAYKTVIVKDQPSEVTQEASEATPAQGSTTISSSCSTSLQVIPVAKQKLESPGENSIFFAPCTSKISSQAFVFQEPEPPQII